jgi:hypothetical protein
MRPPKHQSRYRRFAYFADGRRFVTAATDESHAHIMSVNGHSLGTIDFKGFIGEDKCVNNRRSTDSRNTESNLEYVQSLRTHHEDNDLFGVLMLTYGSNPSSAVGLVRLETGSRKARLPW